MDDFKDQTARLRRTFRYPADDDGEDSQPEAMDEEGKLSSATQLRLFILTPRPQSKRTSSNASPPKTPLAMPRLRASSSPSPSPRRYPTFPR